jgi:hypothetical protein
MKITVNFGDDGAIYFRGHPEFLGREGAHEDRQGVSAWTPYAFEEPVVVKRGRQSPLPLDGDAEKP